ncbi:hypothetical protein [Rhizobium sp. 21-4511-3d]
MCATYLLSRRDVADISCQRRVEYSKGKEHYFDFRVLYKNGYVRLIAARPANKLKHGDLVSRLEQFTNYSLKNHADGWQIMTDHDVTQAVFLHSANILRARALKNEEDCVRMRRLLSNMSDIVKVNELFLEFGRRGAARTAMWNLVDEGLLKLETSEPLRKTMTEVSFLRQVA